MANEAQVVVTVNGIRAVCDAALIITLTEQGEHVAAQTQMVGDAKLTPALHKATKGAAKVLRKARRRLALRLALRGLVEETAMVPANGGAGRIH